MGAGQPAARLHLDRDGTNHLFVYEFGSGKETQLTSGRGRDNQPRFSPDGKWIAFEREFARAARHRSGDEDGSALSPRGRVRHAAVRRPARFAWSPDSDYIAFVSAGREDVSEHQHRGRLPAGEAAGELPGEYHRSGSMSWSPDGTYLTFTTAQRTEPGEVDPRRPDSANAEVPRGSVPRSVPETSSPKTAAGASNPSVPCHLPPLPRSFLPPAAAGAEARRDRLRRHPASRDVLPVGVDVGRQEISPDGKWLLLTAMAAGQQNLYRVFARRDVDASRPSRGS